MKVTRPSEGLVSLVTVTKQRDLPAIDPMAFSLETVELGAGRGGNQITSFLVGRKAKCTPEDLLSLLLADSGNDWQKKAKKEFGIKRSQFLVQK